MKSNECMLSIEGLDCPNCAAKVERKINTLEGIKEATVDFLGKKIVVLADEISPDSCRLWDVDTNQKYDKDVFRQDIGDLIETYKAVLARMENK